MRDSYVLDACALIAYLSGENGCDVVGAILDAAYVGEAKVSMNKLNLLEVYYDAYRVHGKAAADDMFSKVRELPIMLNPGIGDEIFTEAGRLKATYRLSLADSVALAEASASDSTLLTADHHDLDLVEKNENIRFHWIR